MKIIDRFAVFVLLLTAARFQVASGDDLGLVTFALGLMYAWNSCYEFATGRKRKEAADDTR